MGDQKFSLEVRVANGSITNPPHVFIVLTDEFGNEQGYGFAPKINMDLWGPGEISDDTNHRYDQREPYEITAKQYEDLVSYIYQRQKNPRDLRGLGSKLRRLRLQRHALCRNR